MRNSHFSVRTHHCVGIFTLQCGLASSLLVAHIFLPRHSAKSITLQRDVEAHVFIEAHFFRSLGFWHKGDQIRAFSGEEFIGRVPGGGGWTLWS